MNQENFQKVLEIIQRSRSIIDRAGSVSAENKGQVLELVKEAVIHIREARLITVNNFKELVWTRFACEELTESMAAICGVQELSYSQHDMRQSKQLILACVEVENLLADRVKELEYEQAQCPNPTNTGS